MPDMEEKWMHCCECDEITQHAEIHDDPIFIHAYVCLSCGMAWEAELRKEEMN